MIVEVSVFVVVMKACNEASSAILQVACLCHAYKSMQSHVRRRYSIALQLILLLRSYLLEPAFCQSRMSNSQFPCSQERPALSVPRVISRHDPQVASWTGGFLQGQPLGQHSRGSGYAGSVKASLQT